ncbi:MAG: phosphoesterase [Ferruginibacter sp.]|nr:phosphoesterase [Ferruginibacter sp.]
MQRRSFIKKSLIGLTGISVLSGVYAWQIEPFWLEFVKVRMPVKNLPAELVGKTIMQISDIHISNRFNYHYIIDSFQKAKAFNPDFVLYTGDYVTQQDGGILTAQLQEVLSHAVKGQSGTVGILGNHDYGREWMQPEIADTVSQMLLANGITVLRNQQAEIAGLNFIGFDDYWGMNFNPAAVMQHYDPTKANIVLCHNPDVCDLDVWNGHQGWILSGHTHGGQCKPPFLPAPMLPVKNKKYAAGKVDLTNGRTLYVNRALGHLYQVRFNVRPEITIFQLVAG